MRKVTEAEDGAFGLITLESPYYTGYRERLQASTAEDFVRFYLPA